MPRKFDYSNIEYKTYDTNMYIQYFKNKSKVSLGTFQFIDLNICEWLKGKDKATAYKEFVKIDDLIQESNSRYTLRKVLEKYEIILNSTSPTAYKFKIAYKVAKIIFNDLIYHASIIIFLIYTIVLFKKLNAVITDNIDDLKRNNDIEFFKAVLVLNDLKTKAEKHALKKDSRKLFYLSKNDIDEWCKRLYNTLVEVMNKERKYGIKTVSDKHFNTNNIVHANDIKLSETEVKKFIKAIISVKNDSRDEAINFYYKLLYPLLFKGKTFEFNDICDFYLTVASSEMEIEYLSNDLKSIDKHI